MFIHLNKRGQSTLEYALIIAVIIAALIAMQTYFKRGLQGRLKQASDDVGEQFSSGASYYDYTTQTSISSNEEVKPGVDDTSRGGITQTDTTQNVTRTGTEHVAEYGDTGEYWPQ
ncbi:MAG: class III signal peptide-containing protein [Candidatus Omnitrophota bacterium]|jgi:Flp pilus assembly pilin Flp|nr:MAG: class III signal peptide-containing protein [Candidatus Omnitrophota bacterium]